MERIRQYFGLFSLAFMCAIVNIDFTAVNLALPKIISFFNISLALGQQMFSLYLFAASAFFIVGCKLVDLYSKKRIYVFGIFLFFFASLLITVTSDFTYFSVLRMIQGIGYSLVFPTAMLLANQLIPAHHKVYGISLIILISNLSQALGPSLAGVILDSLGWKSIFYINMGVSILAYVLFQFVPSEHESKLPAQFDLVGCFLFYAFFGIGVILTYWNFSLLFSMLISCGGGIVAYMFYRHVQNHKSPFVNLILFKNKEFVCSCVLRMFFNVCWTFIVVYPPVYLQMVQGFSARITSLIIIVFTLISAIATAYSDTISRYVGQGRVLVGSFLLILGVHGVMLTLNLGLSVVSLVLILAFYGLSCGFILPILTKITVGALDDETKGQGLGIFYTLSLISMGIGGYSMGIIMSYVSGAAIAQLTSIQNIDPAQVIQGSQSLYAWQDQLTRSDFLNLLDVLQAMHKSVWLIISGICSICLMLSILICWQMKKKTDRVLSDSIA